MSCVCVSWMQETTATHTLTAGHEEDIHRERERETTVTDLRETTETLNSFCVSVFFWEKRVLFFHSRDTCEEERRFRRSSGESLLLSECVSSCCCCCCRTLSLNENVYHLPLCLLVSMDFPSFSFFLWSQNNFKKMEERKSSLDWW